MKFDRALEIAALLEEATALEHYMVKTKHHATLAVLALDGDLRISRASAQMTADSMIVALSRIEQLELVAKAATAFLENADSQGALRRFRGVVENYQSAKAQRS